MKTKFLDIEVMKMKKELSNEEILRRFEEIDAREPEEPTAQDLAAFEAADKEDPADAITLDDYKMQKEYSGRLLIRIPKALHRDLAEAALLNGVSLNQYAAYKLAK